MELFTIVPEKLDGYLLFPFSTTIRIRLKKVDDLSSRLVENGTH